MKYLLALLAYGGLTSFLGILLWHVPSPDLIAVTTGVLVLAAVDFVRMLRRGGP